MVPPATVAFSSSHSGNTRSDYGSAVAAQSGGRRGAIEGGGRTAGIPELGNAPELTAFYPGRGLSGLELDILFEFFPNIEFRSFEEVLS
jgi:hypothetical protein